MVRRPSSSVNVAGKRVLKGISMKLRQMRRSQLLALAIVVVTFQVMAVMRIGRGGLPSLMASSEVGEQSAYVTTDSNNVPQDIPMAQDIPTTQDIPKAMSERPLKKRVVDTSSEVSENRKGKRGMSTLKKTLRGRYPYLHSKKKKNSPTGVKGDTDNGSVPEIATMNATTEHIAYDPYTQETGYASPENLAIVQPDTNADMSMASSVAYEPSNSSVPSNASAIASAVSSKELASSAEGTKSEQYGTLSANINETVASKSSTNLVASSTDHGKVAPSGVALAKVNETISSNLSTSAVNLAVASSTDSRKSEFSGVMDARIDEKASLSVATAGNITVVPVAAEAAKSVTAVTPGSASLIQSSAVSPGAEEPNIQTKEAEGVLAFSANAQTNSSLPSEALRNQAIEDSPGVERSNATLVPRKKKKKKSHGSETRVKYTRDGRIGEPEIETMPGGDTKQSDLSSTTAVGNQTITQGTALSSTTAVGNQTTTQGTALSSSTAVTNHTTKRETALSSSTAVTNHTTTEKTALSFSSAVSNHTATQDTALSSSTAVSNHTATQDTALSSSTAVSNYTTTQDTALSSSTAVSNHTSAQDVVIPNDRSLEGKEEVTVPSSGETTERALGGSATMEQNPNLVWDSKLSSSLTGSERYERLNRLVFEQHQVSMLLASSDAYKMNYEIADEGVEANSTVRNTAFLLRLSAEPDLGISKGYVWHHESSIHPPEFMNISARSSKELAILKYSGTSRCFGDKIEPKDWSPVLSPAAVRLSGVLWVTGGGRAFRQESRTKASVWELGGGCCSWDWPTMKLKEPVHLRKDLSAESAFSLLQYHGDSAYHIMTEVLPRLLTHYEFLKRNPDIVVLVNGAQARMYVAGMLGVSEEKVIAVDNSKMVFLSVLIAPPPAQGMNEFYPRCVLNNIRHVAWNHLNSTGTRDAIVLIARSKEETDGNPACIQPRCMKNFAELRGQLAEAYSSRYHVVVYPAAGLEFQETVAMFKSAVAIVGVHGAGFSNMAFAEPDTAVIHIGSSTSTNEVGPDWYKNVAVAMGMRYVGLTCPQPFLRHMSSLEVDVKATVEALKKLLS